MSSGRAIPLSVIAGAILLAACVDIPTAANSVLSFQFNPLPSPSVVVGDSLRDSLGVVTPITFKAFNYSGAEITDPGVRFTALDRGIRVDSIKGIVVGDSVRATARIAARIKEFSTTLTIPVTLRPDTVIGANARDSIAYSLTDSVNISPGVSVRVVHGKPPSDTAVASYFVSFRIISQAAANLARLVNDVGVASSADTTDASGVAARRIALDLTKLVTPVDSVIIEATVRYRGAQLRGSPVRLVVKLKPK